jgi:hypothetical protein
MASLPIFHHTRDAGVLSVECICLLTVRLRLVDFDGSKITLTGVTSRSVT